MNRTKGRRNLDRIWLVVHMTELLTRLSKHCHRRREVQLPIATQQRVMTNILKHSLKIFIGYHSFYIILAL